MTQDQLEQHARARLGTTLKDKWTLDTLLGVGGTASVYSASHRNGKRVALKILHPELSAHGHFRERFLREAYVGNHIEHPGAVTVYDDDITPDGCAFLVMDLLEGENLELRRVRKGGVLEPLEVLSLMDDVLDTLQASHMKGVIHRDIKPENLFLTLENTVRLLDFGIARIDVPESPGQTLAGISMGTPAFMPPEQASAHWDKVDQQSDLWAIGASMFTLLTGRYVHQGGTVNESLVLAVTKQAPKVENIDPSLPATVAAIVNRALERDKSRRYKSAAEMQFDVRLACRELQGDISDEERYSLSHGKIGFHSAPPGPVGRASLTSVPEFDFVTGDPVTAEADLDAVRRRPLDKRRLAIWGAAAAAFVISLVWLLSGGDEAPPVSVGTPVGTSSPSAPMDWDELRTRVESDAKKPSLVSFESLPRAADAGEDEGRSPADRGDRAERDDKKSAGSKRRPARPGAPAPPVSAPPQDEFDPFSKRH